MMSSFLYHKGPVIPLCRITVFCFRGALKGEGARGCILYTPHIFSCQIPAPKFEQKKRGKGLERGKLPKMLIISQILGLFLPSGCVQKSDICTPSPKLHYLIFLYSKCKEKNFGNYHHGTCIRW